MFDLGFNWRSGWDSNLNKSLNRLKNEKKQPILHDNLMISGL